MDPKSYVNTQNHIWAHMCIYDMKIEMRLCKGKEIVGRWKRKENLWGVNIVKVSDGLSQNGPQRLIGSGTLKRFGLVGGSVSLRGGLWGFRCSVQAHCHAVFLLLADPDVELSATPLPACHYASHYGETKPHWLNLWTVRQPLHETMFSLNCRILGGERARHIQGRLSSV